MAEKRTTPEAGRRKRAAPTIDLTASEVPQAAAGEPAASAPETPPPPPPEPPAADQTAAPADSGPPGGDPWSWITANFSGPVLMAGLAGAGSVAILLFALWLTGLVPIRYAGSTATRARVAAMEMEIQALQHRPAGAVDTKALDALTERVGKMEAALSKLPAGAPGANSDLAGRVAAVDNAMKSLGVALAALNRRSDNIAADSAQARDRAEAADKAVTELRSSIQIANTASAGLSSADLDALQKRIADLEQSAKTARDEMAKSGAADATARLALSAASLRDVATSGAPFASALAQAKALGADAKSLAPLEPFAVSGVPSAAALAGELRALLPGMIKQSGAQAPSGGFLEKLQANASNLVRIRPVGAPSGDDASAVLARIEIEAANADTAGALADLAKLPEVARAPAQAWITKAQARQAALAAARTLATQTANAFANPLANPIGPR
jgi:hypothetical protein